MSRTYKDTRRYRQKLAKNSNTTEGLIGGIGKAFRKARRKQERARNRQFEEKIRKTLDDSDVPVPRFRRCDEWNYW